MSNPTSPVAKEDQRHRTGCLGYGLVGLAAVTLAWFGAWLGVNLWSSALFDCGVYFDTSWELEFEFVLFVAGFTGSVIALALSLTAARFRPALGLLIATVVAAGTFYVQLRGWDQGGTSKVVFDQGSVQACPSGVPSWWPWWAPR